MLQKGTGKLATIYRYNVFINIIILKMYANRNPVEVTVFLWSTDQLQIVAVNVHIVMQLM